MLKQIEGRLTQAIHLFNRRLEWLTTESRRLFGVVEEKAITIVLDIRNMSPQQFDQYRIALETIIYEQLTQISKFNLIRLKKNWFWLNMKKNYSNFCLINSTYFLEKLKIYAFQQKNMLQTLEYFLCILTNHGTDASTYLKHYLIFRGKKCWDLFFDFLKKSLGINVF